MVLGFGLQDNLDGIEFWICVLVFGLRMVEGSVLLREIRVDEFDLLES